MREKVVSLLGRVRRLLETFLKFVSGKYYIHVADLLYPHKFGLSPVQIIVISRMLDTRLWEKKEDFYWHFQLSKNDDFVMANKYAFDSSYKRFLDNIHINGFNPEKGSLSVALRPYFGMIDGTHRLGYLLAVNPNMYIPVNFGYPFMRFIGRFPQDGKKYFIDRGVKLCDIDKLYASHEELMQVIRFSLTAFFNEAVWFEKNQKIVEAFSEFGTVDEICENMVIENHKYKVMVRFSLKYQEFYFSRGKLRSHVIDKLCSSLDRICLHGEYIIANSVTESIALEESMMDDMANYHC